MAEIRQIDKSRLISHAAASGIIIEGAGHQYKIVKVLGAGGFGITYLVESDKGMLVLKEHFLKGCWRGDDGREVKHAPTVDEDIRTSRADFLEEARRLSILGNDTAYIVKVYDAFEANGTAYYSMEYLDGGDLRGYLGIHGPMPEAEAVDMILSVAKAVGILHASHILHLDIKPSNIVLKKNKTDGTLTPVLIDFGIAKHFNNKGTPTSHLVAKGASSGYAPIEQYDDIEHFAPEIDIYALGGTLYFMLTGKNPPKAFNIDSFDSLRANLPTGLSENTIAAIEGAMRRSCSVRTNSVDLFMSQLCGRKIENNVTVAFFPETKRKKQSNKWFVFGIGFLVIVALALFIGYNQSDVKGSSEKMIVDTIATDATTLKSTINDSLEISEPGQDSSRSETIEEPGISHAENRIEEEQKQAEVPNNQNLPRPQTTNDVAELQRLSDAGSAVATARLARIFYDAGDFDAADKYARKAFYEGDKSVKSVALSVIRDLESIDKYVNDPLPSDIETALKL